jgi:hypothetical protein
MILATAPNHHHHHQQQAVLDFTTTTTTTSVVTPAVRMGTPFPTSQYSLWPRVWHNDNDVNVLNHIPPAQLQLLLQQPNPWNYGDTHHHHHHHHTN